MRELDAMKDLERQHDERTAEPPARPVEAPDAPDPAAAAAGVSPRDKAEDVLVLDGAVRDRSPAAAKSADEGDGWSPSAPGALVPRIAADAFVQDPDVRAALKRAAADRRMVRATLELREGDIEAAIAHYAETPPPELILVEARLARPALFDALERLAQYCPPAPG